jgi:hypothetical protein
MHRIDRNADRFWRRELRNAVPKIKDMSGASGHIAKRLKRCSNFRLDLLGLGK